MSAASKRGQPSPPAVFAVDLQEAIRRRAEEIYERSGRIAGRDLHNWAQAEAEILRELEEQAVRKAAIVVKVKGVRYVGEYSVAAAGGYSPGEFAPGEPIPVRLEGDKMYVTRPNGEELETTIVSRSD